MQDRELRYRLQERRDLEAKYRKGLMRIIQEDVLANKDGHATLGGLIEVQYDIVWHGLRHIGRPLTEKKVVEYLDALFEKGSGESYTKIIGTCCDAIASSGILGIRPDPESDEEDAEGKETASPSPSSSD